VGDVGTVGDVGVGIGLVCESDGFFGGSMPPMATIDGDSRGFADGFFFVSGDGDSMGDMVFVSFFGAAGAALCLFPPTPPEYLPHSPAPSTGGKAGFGSIEADGERAEPIAGLVLSVAGLFLASDASLIEVAEEGEGCPSPRGGSAVACIP
jgi:hypothetical protein